MFATIVRLIHRADCLCEYCLTDERRATIELNEPCPYDAEIAADYYGEPAYYGRHYADGAHVLADTATDTIERYLTAHPELLPA